MPFGNIWTCDSCRHSVRTAGLFKFYIDKNGIRHRCGHPILSEADKRASKIGYTHEGYCPHCKEIRDVIVTIFNDPNKKFPAVCDICHTKLKDNLEGEPCKCGEGHFREEGRWMS